MDKIYECGRKFADLLNCKYHLVVSGNRKIMKLTLDFKETDLSCNDFKIRYAIGDGL